MTYIEFFDREAAENISTCTAYQPERVIYIGNSEPVLEHYVGVYTRIFENRGTPVEFQYRVVKRNDLDDAVAVLSEIVETYDNCVFDVTGGEELLTVALGVVYGKYLDKDLKIHKVNLQENEIYDCARDGTVVCQKAPVLSVEENIMIHGGDIAYGDVHSDDTYLWDLSESFQKDINKMWDIGKTNPRLWNVQMGVFAAAEQVGEVDEDGLTTRAKITQIESLLKKERASYKIIKGIVGSLQDKGLLTCFEEADGMLTVSYKDPQVKRCLVKAGTMLEMKMMLVARNVTDRNGPVYDQVMSGVVIDWDGKFHDETVEDEYDTENEVDLMLMHDMIPVFVSCKNGDVKPEELYKLNTVANRFGGRYAKKVLVTTCLSKTSESALYLRQRAKDMKIQIVEDLKDCTEAQLEKKFRKLWKR